MKSIQARLQSRISLRATTISSTEFLIKDSKNKESWYDLKVYRKRLNELAFDQILDKDIIRNTHWR